MTRNTLRLVQLGVSSLALLSLWPNSPMGRVGHGLAFCSYTALGYGAWLAASLLVVNAWRQRPKYTTIFAAVTLQCTWLHLIKDGAGGWLGTLLGQALIDWLGAGGYVAAVIVSLAAAHTWTQGRATRQVLQAKTAVARNVLPRAKQSIARAKLPQPTAQVIDLDTYRTDEPGLYELDEPTEPTKPTEPTIERPKALTLVQSSGFNLPPPTLLDQPEASKPFDKKQAEILAEDITDKLATFEIKGRVTGIQPGPVVTLFEYDPIAGTKVDKIQRLDMDLTRELKRPVRIVPVLANSACVGIEVPLNDEDRRTISLRELLEDREWSEQKGLLPIVVGKRPDDTALYADLSAMPHLLIAGATGAGKSVALNSMLVSLLYKCTPKQLRLILIDPKVVEFVQFTNIPHLLVPVITEVEPALVAMRWAMREMDRRYELLGQLRVKNVASYNEQVSAEDRLPMIVVVVDEYADLIAVGGKELEHVVQRIAQKARAAGIHLILATQRPSVDVITGVIKANMVCRIAFKVASREDSKTILGTATRADQLIGKGDLLAKLPGSMDLQRAHSAYLSDAELERVCNYLRAQAEPVFDDNVLANVVEASNDTSEYDRALAQVVRDGYCSVSALQKALGIGYVKASKLVDQLYEQGVIGPPSAKAGGRREVYASNLDEGSVNAG